MAGGGFGQYTGYAPLPGGGGYSFTKSDGSTVAFPGPQAEDLKRQIDESRGVAAYQRGAGPLAPGAGVPTPGPGALPPAPPPSASRVFGTKGGGSIALKDGGDPSNPAHYVKTLPGTAGSRGGLQQLSQTQQGGYELDPERVAAVTEANQRIVAAQADGAQKMAELSAERAAAAAEERAQLQREAAVVQHEQSVKEQQVTELRAKHEAAQKDFLETPERQREAREGNTGRNIIEGIALALGSLGAGLARTPNFAMQTIESIHEREMRADEAALRVKKEGADSLLGRLKDELGSIDQAKLSYRAIRSRDAAIRLESLAQRTNDEQQRSNLLTAAAQMNETHAKWLEALERGAQGEVTKAFRFNQPTAASGPRQVGITLEEAGQIADLKGKGASTAKTEAETGKTLAELQSGGAGAKISDTSANALANIRSVRGQLPSLKAASEHEGLMVWDASPAGDANAKKFLANAETLARLAGKAVEGDAAAESNVKALTARLTSPLAGTRAAALDALDNILTAKETQMKKIVPGAK